MTRAAIQAGFAQLQASDAKANLAEAARSRSEADWLVGMNATRAATVRCRSPGGVVSLGRVQTPTLALIVQRDRVIEDFTPEAYFHIEAEFALTGIEPRHYLGHLPQLYDLTTLQREDA